MADYKPQALDLRDVGATVMGSPARAAMYAGVSRRNPALLGGFAAAEGRTLRNLANRAYSENADVNAMLNELAQSDQAIEGRKNELDFGKQLLQTYDENGYRNLGGDIASEYGYEDLGNILTQGSLIPDTAAVENTRAQAYNRLASGQASLRNADANVMSAKNEGGWKSIDAYNPLTGQHELRWEYKGGAPLTAQQLQAAGQPPGQSTFGLKPLEAIDQTLKQQGGSIVSNTEVQKDDRTGREIQGIVYQDTKGNRRRAVIDANTGEVLDDEGSDEQPAVQGKYR